MTEFEWEFHRFIDNKTTRPGDDKVIFCWELLRDDPGQLVRRNTKRYLENKRTNSRDDWLSRLHCFRDENIPLDILRRINFMLPRKKAPRKLSEYTQEEMDNFPVIWSKTDNYRH